MNSQAWPLEKFWSHNFYNSHAFSYLDRDLLHKHIIGHLPIVSLKKASCHYFDFDGH